MEPLVDECFSIFIRSMKNLEGKKGNLGGWVRWYAFGVIGMITFNHRYGFMEERKDVLNMISSLELLDGFLPSFMGCREPAPYEEY